MIIYCDGSFCPCLPDKPGFAAWTAWEGGREIACWYGQVNVRDAAGAEAMAVYRALSWAVKGGHKTIIIYSDNRYIIDQLSGRRMARNLFIQILKLVKRLDKTGFIWIHRSKNKRADRLCRLAAKEYKKAA